MEESGLETQRFVMQNSGASLVLLDNDGIRVCQLDIKAQWSIGRWDPIRAVTPDISFTSPIVSREHGWISNVDGQWYYVDNPQNLNGTFHNGYKIPRPMAGQRRPVPLENGDILRIDNDDLDHVNRNGVLMLFTTAQVHGEWATCSLQRVGSMYIGRDASCRIREEALYFSARHAKIKAVRGQYYLSDCGSMAGTYVNGQQVQGTHLLREKDCISICDSNYFFLGDRLLYCQRNREMEHQILCETTPSLRPVVLRADIATKRVKNNSGSGMKELIRDIHIEIKEGTLVALLGTAGAGKSTVMNCLNGMDLEGVQGAVTYRGVDLMKHFDQMSYLIGSVPQEKIFHEKFTPEEEFELAAKTRLPARLSRTEIRERVDRTIEMLSLQGVRKNWNCKLSGGEKTRVNIGIELVADRELLCLDEPDQGLSPNYKLEVFQIMQELAHSRGKSVEEFMEEDERMKVAAMRKVASSQGKTILSIIHDVSHIDMFDQVIMLAKVDGVGRLAFSGSPEEAREYFGVDIKDAYALLEREPERFVR